MQRNKGKAGELVRSDTGARKAEKKAADKRDKVSGLSGDKKQAREEVRSQVVDTEREFIKPIAETQGRNEENLTAKVPDALSPEAAEKFRKAHDKDLLKFLRHRLLEPSDASSESCVLQNGRLGSGC